MPALAYGVWDDVVYDNRGGGEAAAPPLDMGMFDEFSRENPARLFMSDRGFLVFDEKAPLLWALCAHLERLAAESCGRCSPCRAGAPIIRDALQAALSGESADFDLIYDIASQMAQTSLCGIGQTGVKPLLDALEHFRNELAPGQGPENCHYSAVSSPCIEACPGLVNIPRYIDYIRDGNSELAAGVVMRRYPLVGSCGRVCVRSCEKACRRALIDEAVSIRDLKRFAADEALGCTSLTPRSAPDPKRPRVAVVGAGPVGLSCAYHLLDLGYPVDIFEARDKAGGMIRYGIPVYRLPKDILQNEIDIVRDMGAQFFFGQALGRDFDLDELFRRGYAAVFISTGAPLGAYLGMKDEDASLPGYENGIEFLDRVYSGLEKGQPPTLEGDVVIVGGGNVAMDCCRAARRLATGQVHLIYRRTEKDAPADPEEIRAAREEGVQFHFLCGQDQLVAENGVITGLRVLDMEQTEPDESGRRGVRPIDGSAHVIPCSHVIAAIGQRADPAMLRQDEGVERDSRMCVRINGAHETSRPGVFAGGDCTAGPRSAGPATMIMGMGQACFAARSIDQYLSGATPPFDPRWRLSEWIARGRLMDGGHVAEKPARKRVGAREIGAEQRACNFDEVEQTMGRDEAWREAARCLRCYRVFSVLTSESIPGMAASGHASPAREASSAIGA